MKPSPSYEQLYPYSQFSGAITYREQHFKYLYLHKGPNRWVFIFDPQTDGITLTNAIDQVLEPIIEQLTRSHTINEGEVADLIDKGTWLCRDSYGEYSQIILSGVTNQLLNQAIKKTLGPLGQVLPSNLSAPGAGLRVKSWKHFDFSKEFFELFKLLG